MVVFVKCEINLFVVLVNIDDDNNDDDDDYFIVLVFTFKTDFCSYL